MFVLSKVKVILSYRTCRHRNCVVKLTYFLYLAVIFILNFKDHGAEFDKICYEHCVTVAALIHVLNFRRSIIALELLEWEQHPLY